MNYREIIVHRLRDLDSVFRAKNKLDIMFYVFLRQFYKLFHLNEEKLSNLLKRDGSSELFGKIFYTRKKTLDFLFISKYYEPETTKEILRGKGRVFIDVGAHIGRFALIASDFYEKVYAIEPHPSNFESLKKNIQKNNAKNVVGLNYAISDNEKNVFFEGVEMNTGAAKIGKKGKLQTKAYPLSKIISAEEIDIGKIDLILIDVEGHELEVLEGAKEILEKGKAKIIIESFSREKITNFLSGYGYKKKKILDFYNHLFEKG